MSDRAKVGDVEIMAFIDATPPPFETSQFFPDVPKEKWEPYKAESLTADGKLQVNFGFFVLRSHGSIVIVDTGLGPGPFPNFGGARGALADHLHRNGIQPQDVNAVVITHLHGDHIGWNMSMSGGKPQATFPRAKYYIPRADWDYYTKPDVLANNAAVKDSILPLKELNCMELVGGDHTVTPEITTLSTPGHTPGHTCVLINSQGQKGIVVGDLFHTIAQVTENAWNPGFDWDKEQSQKSRVGVMERLEREGFTVAGGHLPVNRSIGKIVRLQGRRYWQVI